MKPLVALAAFAAVELRRQLPAVATGWALLLPLPLVHRLSEGNWGYWSSWGLSGAALALALGLPLLAATLAVPLLSAEREDGTLTFFYARPVSGGAVFWMRLTALVLSLSLFAAGVLLFHLRAPGEVGEALAGFVETTLGRTSPFRPSAIWFSVLALGGTTLTALAAGSLVLSGAMAASAVAASSGRALRGLVIAAIALVLALTLGFWSLIEWGAAGLWDVARVNGLFTLAFALWTVAAVAGALAVVRRVPLDPHRGRRALRVAVVPVLLGVVALLPLALHPAELGEPRLLGVRALDTPATLEVFRTPYLWRQLAAVRLGEGGAAGPILATTVPGFGLGESAAPAGAPLVLWDAGDPEGRWLLVSAGGEAEPVTFPPELGSGSFPLEPWGWSPGGRRFAWRHPRGRVLAVLDAESREVQLLDLPEGSTAGVWLDDERWVAHTFGPGDSPGEWWVLDARDRGTRGPFPAPEELSPLSFGTRYRGRPALVRRVADEPRLLVLSAGGEAFETVTRFDRPPRSVGELPDGGLVWMVGPGPGEDGEVQVRVLRPDGTVTDACRLPQVRPSVRRRFVEAAGNWAAWVEGVAPAFHIEHDLRASDEDDRARESGGLVVHVCNLVTHELRSAPLRSPLKEDAIDLTADRLLGPGWTLELGP